MIRPIFDIYNQRIVQGDIYFYTSKGKVHFDNVCRYVEENFEDFEANEIESDLDLIAYLEELYFFDTYKHENEMFQYWI